MEAPTPSSEQVVPKRTLEDVMDDDDDDDDFEDDKPVKRPRVDEEDAPVDNSNEPSIETSELNESVNEERDSTHAQVDNANNQVEGSLAVAEETLNTAEAAASDEQNIPVVDGTDEQSKDNTTAPIDTLASPQTQDEVVTLYAQPAITQEAQDGTTEVTVEKTETLSTAAMDAHAFLDAQLLHHPTAPPQHVEQTAVSSVDALSLPSVHQCVVDILADIQTTHPSVVLDDAIVGELNNLSVSDALAVMQAFQAAISGNPSQPIPALMHELIATQRATRRPQDDISRSAEEEEEAPPTLSEAIWTRLLDFQHSAQSDFHLSQIRPATMDALASLPEYAQLAIVSRFARIPPGTRNKDAQLMQTLQDYERENPLLRGLEHVSKVVPDYKSDPGLFAFGFAPPQPASGMIEIAPRRLYNLHAELKQHQDKFLLDEFDQAMDLRALHRASTLQLIINNSSINLHHTILNINNLSLKCIKVRDMILVKIYDKIHDKIHDRILVKILVTILVMILVKIHDRILDPRQDPRRGGGPPPMQHQSFGPPLLNEFRRSEIYRRLPPPIRDVLEALYAKGHIKELLNDSVLSRLLKLPEHLAVRAVENLINTDASHVDNVNGFFVGIITRVYERDRGPPPSVPGAPMMPPHMQPPPHNMDPRQAMHPSAPMRQWSKSPVHDQYIRALPPAVLAQLQHMAATGVMSSVDEWGEKCYEILGQLSEGLAIEVLKRFTMANLESVRNRSGFLIGVVKRCRQEYGLP
ncbi:hypothetical protein AeRB84_011948 [Aphanomyces euteiches]|nr:hypothetical protein AeRB84_011948 [Aphanomyces euteiches]